MVRIFMSYSTYDGKIAYKIYADLLRAGADVYLYEGERMAGVNFEKEIYSKIDVSDFFCLIDSEHSRRSEWVKKECNYALSQTKDNSLKIIPCILGPKETWFDGEEIFANQKLIRGIDFSNLDYLDHMEKYRGAISKLCENTGLVYDPWSEIPQDRDFEKEISTNILDLNQRDFLISDYKNFKRSIQSGSETRFSRIQNLISDSERIGVRTITAFLALGALHSEKDRADKALEVFESCAKQFDNDARSWAALSGVQYFLKDYNGSYDSNEMALSIIKKNPSNEYLQRHLSEILLNKIQVLIARNRYKEAKELLNESKSMSKIPDYKVMRIKLNILSNGDFSMGEYKYLKKNYSYYKLEPGPLEYKIADLEYVIGEFFLKKSILKKSLKHFREAHEIDKKNIQYMANCFLVEKALNRLNEKQALREIEAIEISRNVDHYYLGLVYYLCGRKEKATELYKRSDLEGWYYYDQII